MQPPCPSLIPETLVLLPTLGFRLPVRLFPALPPAHPSRGDTASSRMGGGGGVSLEGRLCACAPWADTWRDVLFFALSSPLLGACDVSVPALAAGDVTVNPAKTCSWAFYSLGQPRNKFRAGQAGAESERALSR